MNDENTTVFARATEKPCPVCLEMARAGEICRETVMPLSVFGPISIADGKKCCHDCQAAENLVKYHLAPSFLAARIAVGNERQETLRMPYGMAEVMGLCSYRLMMPASLNDFAPHMAWLDKVLPVPEDYGEPS